MLVNVDRVAADVAVVVVACVSVIAIKIIPVVVVEVVVAVVAAIVIATVPTSVSIVGSAVIDNCGAVPSAVPAAISPTTATTGHHGAHSDSSTESDNSSSRDITRGVCRSHITWNHVGVAVHDGWIVLRYVDNLRIGWLNDDGLWRLLHHSNLGTGFEISFLFGLSTQGLNRGHDLRLLIVVGLS